MKQLKTLLLTAALCVGTISFAQAQSKVAHINTQELVKAMPEATAAKKQLETLGKTYQTDIQNMATEFKNKMKQYEAEAPTKTDEENVKRGQEIEGMRQNIQQYQAKAQQDLGKKETELFKPIQEKALKAINTVAKAQGFHYVLDSGLGVTLVAEGKDLLPDVKKQLGI